MPQFLYLDGLNDIVIQISELAASNSHFRYHQRDFMDEIRMLDKLARKQEIALSFAGLRRFEIENEIEALEETMFKNAFFIDEDLIKGRSSISWFELQRIRVVQKLRRSLIDSFRRELA